MKLHTLLEDRSRLFWTLNVAGWGGYVIAPYLGALAHEKPDSYIAVVVATAVMGFVLTIPMRSLYRALWSRSPLILALGVVSMSYVLALFWRWIQNLLYFDWVKDSWQPETFTDYIGGVLGSFYVLLC